MKRQRGRGRKPGGGGGGGGNFHNNQGGHHHPNRQLETNGPDTKFRGTASYIHERYLALARDAASSGDRVLSENYLQHADHYFRLVRSMQPATPPPQQQQQDRFGSDAEFEGGEEAGDEGEGAEEGEIAASGDEQPDVEFPQGQQQQQQFDRHGEGRGPRRRRNRFRGDGDREGGEGGGERRERPEGEQRAERDDRPRDDRPPRRERQPRERDNDQGPEGFSNGPKPAFLRSGD